MLWRVCFNGDVIISQFERVSFGHLLFTFKWFLVHSLGVNIETCCETCGEKEFRWPISNKGMNNSFFYDWSSPIYIHSHLSVNLHWLQMETLHSFLLVGCEFYWTFPVGLYMTQISLIPSSILKASAFVECDQIIRAYGLHLWNKWNIRCLVFYLDTLGFPGCILFPNVRYWKVKNFVIRTKVNYIECWCHLFVDTVYQLKIHTLIHV